MKRLWQFTLNALIVLSLVLCVATVVQWVHSYRQAKYLRRSHPPKLLQIWSAEGVLQLSWGTLVSQQYPLSPGWSGGGFWPFPSQNVWVSGLRSGTTFGFRYKRQQLKTPSISIDAYLVTFPLWFPAMCFAAFPLAVGYRAWRKRRRKIADGSRPCPICNYDLRATPDRCPECGAIPSNAQR